MHVSVRPVSVTVNGRAVQWSYGPAGGNGVLTIECGQWAVDKEVFVRING